MVFSRSDAKLTSCPGCGMESDQDGGTASIWYALSYVMSTVVVLISSSKECGMWFQRLEEIVEYQDTAASLRAESLQYFEKVERHAHPELIRNQPLQRKRKLKTSNVEEDMSFYKRVRLLHRKYVGLPTNHENIPRNFESTKRERRLSQGCNVETNIPKSEPRWINVAARAGRTGDIRRMARLFTLKIVPHSMREPTGCQILSLSVRELHLGCRSQVWTVHISLLPTFAQPFPFEKGTEHTNGAYLGVCTK